MNKIQKGDICTIDTYRVKQYEGTRIVSGIIVLKTPKKTDKTVLCRSTFLEADVLVYKSDLKGMARVIL
jgi:hypothetical protein